MEAMYVNHLGLVQRSYKMDHGKEAGLCSSYVLVSYGWMRLMNSRDILHFFNRHDSG